MAISGNAALDQQSHINDLVAKHEAEKHPRATAPMQPNVKFSKEQCPEDGSAKQQRMKGRDYAGLIGPLLHACNTRPDIQHAVNALSAFMARPAEHTHINSDRSFFRTFVGILRIHV